MSNMKTGKYLTQKAEAKRTNNYHRIRVVLFSSLRSSAPLRETSSTIPLLSHATLAKSYVIVDGYMRLLSTSTPKSAPQNYRAERFATNCASGLATQNVVKKKCA